MKKARCAPAHLAFFRKNGWFLYRASFKNCILSKKACTYNSMFLAKSCPERNEVKLTLLSHSFIKVLLSPVQTTAALEITAVAKDTAYRPRPNSF